MHYKGCSLITPNLRESIEMTGIEQDIIKMGKKLVRMLDCNVFITRGPEGISVFDKKGHHTHVPPVKITKLYDVTGAGDTVVAMSALGMASRLNLVEIATMANNAAGLVVQKPGTSVVTQEELKNVFRREISHYLKESIEVKQLVIEKQIDKIEKAAHMFIDAYSDKKKVVAFGNGGSASDAQHLVGELVGRFRIERKALPAVALTTDSSVVTAIANDYGYENVFERQVEANAVKGDVVVGISTSGNSPNVIKAIKKAKQLGCKTIGLTGKEGGKMIDLCDVTIVVPSDNTPRIQEAHIAIIHILCELLDKELDKKNAK
jgi:D-sedoheptulose 7-phosphate isomerase